MDQGTGIIYHSCNKYSRINKILIFRATQIAKISSKHALTTILTTSILIKHKFLATSEDPLYIICRQLWPFLDPLGGIYTISSPKVCLGRHEFIQTDIEIFILKLLAWKFDLKLLLLAFLGNPARSGIYHVDISLAVKCLKSLLTSEYCYTIFSSGR